MDHVTTMDDLSMDGLFSSRVITVSGRPSGIEQDLHPVELASVENAVEKRRIEFNAGRALARKALRRLGLPESAIPVGDKREPVWPEGVVGSISHTRDFCGVAVAFQRDVRGLGFDVERVNDVKIKLRSHIVTEKELDALQHALGQGAEVALALAFSGKEAFFKYQFPLSRAWLGLLDVELRADGNEFGIVPCREIPHVCRKGDTIRGRFKFTPEYVQTGIEVEA